MGQTLYCTIPGIGTVFTWNWNGLNWIYVMNLYKITSEKNIAVEPKGVISWMLSTQDYSAEVFSLYVSIFNKKTGCLLFNLGISNCEEMFTEYIERSRPDDDALVTRVVREKQKTVPIPRYQVYVVVKVMCYI